MRVDSDGDQFTIAVKDECPGNFLDIDFKGADFKWTDGAIITRIGGRRDARFPKSLPLRR